jgi:hypothetical protein
MNQREVVKNKKRCRGIDSPPHPGWLKEAEGILQSLQKRKMK